MPITMNSFTCPKGHPFEANAKLRARCPECGTMTRKSFTETKPEPKPEHTEPIVKKVAIKAPVLLRQGRARKAALPEKPVVKPPVVAKKPSVPKKPIARTTGRVSAGLVKSHRITRKVTPVIKTRPIKTAPARGIQGHEYTRPYWHEVVDKYGL